MKIAFAGLKHGHIFVLYDMAKNHPEYEIVGAFEGEETYRKHAESKGVRCNYQSYDALLSDTQVEVVALGGAYGERGEMAKRALLAGKHVIADKPLCTKKAELDEIRAAAKKSGKCVSVMLTMRYEPKMIAAKKLFESGALGEINNVSFGGQHPLQYGRRPDWYFEKEMHGGLFNDIAIHGIDALSYAFDLTVEKVNAARLWNCFAKEETGFCDSGQLMLTAESGAGILADVSYAIPDGVEFALPYYWQFYIWGTKGVLSFALNEKESTYYLVGDKEPHILEEEPAPNYLDDFLRMVRGESGVILPMQEALSSTEKTLAIQELAERFDGGVSV
ncbi:MAG: Gfo/Idh/MocA family oxidoreductase [Clostridia bacterium]|nr:Gfo/Idh/MocA family oxidoreductase [Clostridia bacterium]